MAKEKTTSTQPPDPGVGQPPVDDSRKHEILLTEVAKLQSDAEHRNALLTELRSDMREVRDRMARLEVRVDHLPTNARMIGAVLATITIVSGMIALAPKLQSLVGTAPAASTTAK